MVTREYITNYLRINAISDSLSTQELSSELARIGWKQGDIADAVRALHGEVPTTETADRTTKMLYSDATLPPDAVVSLLNIHLKHTPKRAGTRASRRGGQEQGTEVPHTLAAIFVAIFVAGVTCTAAMYFFKIGPFYS